RAKSLNPSGFSSDPPSYAVWFIPSSTGGLVVRCSPMRNRQPLNYEAPPPKETDENYSPWWWWLVPLGVLAAIINVVARSAHSRFRYVAQQRPARTMPSGRLRRNVP